MAGVKSPCNSVCKIDPATDLCMGCFRTLAEIAAWGEASEAEQRAIAERALKRLGGEGETKRCSHCRTEFSCGAAEGHCWCMDRPKVKIDPAAGDCLCPICLGQRTA
jgi:predicted Fe-S protein YdhL (DUF1289 family)